MYHNMAVFNKKTSALRIDKNLVHLMEIKLAKGTQEIWCNFTRSVCFVSHPLHLAQSSDKVQMCLVESFRRTMSFQEPQVKGLLFPHDSGLLCWSFHHNLLH